MYIKCAHTVLEYVKTHREAVGLINRAQRERFNKTLKAEAADHEELVYLYIAQKVECILYSLLSKCSIHQHCLLMPWPSACPQQPHQTCLWVLRDFHFCSFVANRLAMPSTFLYISCIWAACFQPHAVVCIYIHKERLLWYKREVSFGAGDLVTLSASSTLEV